MNSTFLPPFARPGQLVRPALVGALLLVCGQAMALYKVVGPDGKVTYTDRPPVDQPSQSLKTNGAVSDTGSLPYEVRQAATRYPVTLYTSPDCSVCDQGRNALKQRGVPFVEKSIRTDEDEKALQRLEGVSNIPVLRIGAQQLQGYADRDWQSYLDAAGYPKQSTLPKTYQWPTASPLVTPAPAAAASSTARRARATPSPAPADQASNPAGIRF